MEDKWAVDVGKLTFELTKMLNQYLNKLIEYGGSDLHVKSGSNIRARINGEILALSKGVLTHADGLTLAKELLRNRFKELVEKKSVDFTHKLNEDYRFRVNMFFQVDGVSAVFRTIPAKIPTIESLNLPQSIYKICKAKRGIILVTGPTGSGKTTTLAAIINYFNKTRKQHIITIEDPVEFVYQDQLCLINQRAIGQDSLDFASSLRAALREDPDIILVGEMRDLETIETAIHAAETGHLVLSTLHTVDAKETVGRILGMFEGPEQHRIRLSLASVLQGVISQRLIQKEGGGRIAAVEVLVRSARISDMIIEGRETEITDAIKESGINSGNQTFDDAIFNLFTQNLISEENAILNASTPNDIKIRVENHKRGVSKEAAQDDIDRDIVALKSTEDDEEAKED